MRASNCKYETSNGRCGLKGSYAYRHKCFTEDLCKCHEPMTNADRIRSMTDKEMANYLVQTALQQCPCPTKDCEAFCNDCLLHWLKQTYKEDT